MLRYKTGQKYEAHYDYFHDSVNVQNGGQRIATVLLYLCAAPPRRRCERRASL